MMLPTQAKQTLESALAEKGLRSTRQRECVFAVVAASEDHPTADAIYSRVRESLSGITGDGLQHVGDPGLVRPDPPGELRT